LNNPAPERFKPTGLIDWLCLEPCAFYNLSHIFGIHILHFYREHLLRAIGVNFPLHNTFGFCHERRNSADAAIAIYIGFEFERFHTGLTQRPQIGLKTYPL